MSTKKSSEHAPDNYDEGEAGGASARIAAYLGAQSNWDDPAESLEVIADMLHTFGGFRHPGNTENTPYYRHQQALYGIPDETEDEL